MSEHDIPRPGPLDDRLLRHAQFPRNLGLLASLSGWAKGVGKCGDSLEVTIRVDGERIDAIKVLPNGCIYTVACASAMSELAAGMTIERALELSPEDVEKALGGLPTDHLHCARLAINTLGEAISDHYQKTAARAAER